jgi:hypothetical protein
VDECKAGIEKEAQLAIPKFPQPTRPRKKANTKYNALNEDTINTHCFGGSACQTSLARHLTWIVPSFFGSTSTACIQTRSIAPVCYSLLVLHPSTRRLGRLEQSDDWIHELDGVP